nr:hypothetical protein [Bacteroidota bacterium]
VIAVLAFSVVRLLTQLIKERRLRWETNSQKKIAIVGNNEEGRRVLDLLKRYSLNFSCPGIISPNAYAVSDENFIGHLDELKELIHVYDLNEIIFCAKDIAYHYIIEQTIALKDEKISFRIVADGSKYIVGSTSKESKGDYYKDEEPLAINLNESRFNKRVFDIVAATFLLLTLPLNIWFVNMKGALVKNIFAVFQNRRSWVGYSDEKQRSLPALKKGVLAPADQVKIMKLDDATLERLNYLYAKDYTVYKDLSIFFSGFSKLGG